MRPWAEVDVAVVIVLAVVIGLILFYGQVAMDAVRWLFEAAVGVMLVTALVVTVALIAVEAGVLWLLTHLSGLGTRAITSTTDNAGPEDSPGGR